MKTTAQQKFEESRKDYSDKEIQMELLYSNYTIFEATNSTKSNTGFIVWVIIIGIILSVVLSLSN